MEIVINNPFRILGLQVNATDRTIAKRISELSVYTDLNKEISFPCDNYFSVKPIRTVESIQEAAQKIEQYESKLFYALFWVWENPKNVIDKMALNELNNSNLEKAIDFLEKGINQAINENNFSNYKNIFSLYYALAVSEDKVNLFYFTNAIKRLGSFISNGFIEKFAIEIIPASSSINIQELKINVVETIISNATKYLNGESTKDQLSYKLLLEAFDKYPPALKKIVDNKLTGKYFYNIEKIISTTKHLLEEGKRKQNRLGAELYKNTKSDFEFLNIILSKSNISLQLISDKLAETLMDCSVAYFNKYQNSGEDPGDDALRILKYAKEIACGDKVKSRIDEGFPIIERYINNKENRDKIKFVKSHYDFIINKLNALDQPNLITINNTIDSCIPKLGLIETILGYSDLDYVKLCDMIANVSLALALENMKNNPNRTSEYINNLHMIFTKVLKLNISPSLRNTINIIKNNNSFNSSINSSSGACYIATMVYKSYDAPEVLVLRKFRDNVLQKTCFGRKLIRQYYKYSPGFVEKFKDNKKINLIIKNLLDVITKHMGRYYEN